MLLSPNVSKTDDLLIKTDLNESDVDELNEQDGGTSVNNDENATG